MTKRLTRTGQAFTATAAALLCGLAFAVPAASASGPSQVCTAAGLPSTTQTVGVTGVFHVTVFTCGNATATGFQACPNQTVAVPNVMHATVYYCVPLSIGVGFGPVGDSVTIGGVGGVNAGTG